MVVRDVVASLLIACALIGCGGGGGGGGGEAVVAIPPTASSSPTPPPAASGLAVTSATPTAVSLQWETVAGASDYRVMRGTQQLILAEESQTRFRDVDLSPASSYEFAVEALNPEGAVLRRVTLRASTAAGPAELVMADGVPAAVAAARALTTFGWTPNPLYDTCPKWLHDSFWTFGPDNKAYPTWHPPVYEFANGSTCRFGHEHGQDQRQSNLFQITGPIPFGYVNEQLSPLDPSFQRNEDHVGHKVAMFNALPAVDRDTGEPADCDVLFKLHQGGWSADAFRNPAHERFLNYQCTNGFAARWKSLQTFGRINTFTQEVSNTLPREEIVTAGAFPAEQGMGGDRRIIPTAVTIPITTRAGATTEFVNKSRPDPENFVDNCDNCRGTNGFPAYISAWNREVWQGGPGLRLVTNSTPQAVTAFGFGGGPYWHVANSARYYDAAADPNPANNATYRLGRQIDLCFAPQSAPYATLECRLARVRNGGNPISWDSPLSPFNATMRFNEFNFVSLTNERPENQRLFTTVFGNFLAGNNDVNNVTRSRSAMFPIRQFFGVTRGNRHMLAANWAGTASCGGRTGAGSCWTDFRWYRLKNGTVVDAGIHAPN